VSQTYTLPTGFGRGARLPGGVVDLRYRFRLDGDRIAELVIAP
jgi:hypothetical protein